MRLYESLMLVMLLSATLSLPAQADSPTYRSDFTRWQASTAEFHGWQRSGVLLTSTGALQLNPRSASPGTDPYAPGSYNGHNFYNGGSFLVGEATSPVTTPSTGFREAIASWNASTPAGSWIEPQIRARVGKQWTTWYSLGVWAADSGTVERHSVNDQADNNGAVWVDTLALRKTATAFQLKLRLFSADGVARPTVTSASVASSTSPSRPRTLAPGNPQHWGTLVQVPTCSQMVYPDGGNVWCSPTSLSMVLGYWTGDQGPCEPRVRAAVDGVYDWLYDGHGNWPFNTAYAATRGMEAYVARFTSMAQAEPWLSAGVPVIISYAWNNDLDGAPASSSNGHLAVLVGFDAAGNPILNDPAAPSDATVRRTYRRDQLEPLWLEHSGGTVYLVYPAGHGVPEL